jgi:hypothetical protein
MSELASVPAAAIAEVKAERPRGGFSFDLYARDATLGSKMASAGQILPAATKTG